VATNRTMATDTDQDGMSDYAEFIAGTNPTNAESRFSIGGTIQSNRLVQIQWTVAANRQYRVSASKDLKTWTPLSGWLQASNSQTMSYFLTNWTGSQFYRVRVLP
ncbi:MAG TPA: thrombospondin type 3 repeat-containing protein, partial [Verrucomicrobiae bacterium]|nr:thrombospondin type 3 repeat-containing protein [Verrucomicrobiae bacterium]